MKRMFLSISKEDKLRFLGHLDLLRTVERAVVRAEIPVAFSAGFNPHMKIAFDAALGVGVSANPLYMDIRLEKDISCDRVRNMLSAQLPEGITIHEIKEAEPDEEKLVTFFNEDVYEMEGPLSKDKNLSGVKDNINRFNQAESFIYTRITPKKVREMDIKPMILSPMRVSIKNDRAYLSFSLVRSQNGTVQPKDIWKLLAESFDMPWNPDEFICSRVGAYRVKKGKRMTPFSQMIPFDL